MMADPAKPLPQGSDQKRSIGRALAFAAAAIDEGDLGRARNALGWVLQHDRGNAEAWFWMACCVEDESYKRECYMRASAQPALAV